MIIHLLHLFRFLLPKSVTAITLWPFIVFRKKEDKTSERIINHERIHLRQQIELLVLPFYVIYLAEYLYLFIKLRNHDQAYRSISFEREAYAHDYNLDYLQNRKLWAVWRN